MTTIGPKKDGGPNIDFFQSPESLAQFDQIRVWLQKNCKKHVQTDPPTKEGLAQLVVQLIQYQENKLGKNASDPPFLRLPVVVLESQSTSGIQRLFDDQQCICDASAFAYAHGRRLPLTITWLV